MWYLWIGYEMGKVVVIDSMVTFGNVGNRLMESGIGVREVLEKEVGSRM